MFSASEAGNPLLRIKLSINCFRNVGSGMLAVKSWFRKLDALIVAEETVRGSGYRFSQS